MLLNIATRVGLSYVLAVVALAALMLVVHA